MISSITSVPPPKKKKKNNCKFNVSYAEKKAINSLKEREDIVTEEADKGSCMVIMAKSFYLQHVYQIIDDPSSYSEINADKDNKLMKKISKLSTKYKSELTEKGS